MRQPRLNCARKRRSFSKNRRRSLTRVAQHREALDAHAEGVALPARRVDAAGGQHVRVHHAAAEDLEPAGLLADAAAGAVAEHALDVDLGRRLGEREVRRPEAQAARLLEELLGEAGEHALEVREADVLVEHEALDLVEHRRVRHVRVAAVDRARARSRGSARPAASSRGSAPARCACAAAARRRSRRCRASPAPDGWRGC